jgi:TetR/AcrR family transcriptional regulator, repressor for uid operon
MNPNRGRRPDPAAREERRHQILMAALECFVAKGFHNATTAEISAAAGISVAGLYQYFPSKEDLVAAIVDWDARENIRRAHHIRDASDFLGAIEVVMLELTKDDGVGHQRLRLEILCEAGRNERIANIVSIGDGRILDALKEAVVASQERGQIDPTIDPQMVAIAMNSLSDGTLARLNLQPEARGPYLSAAIDFLRRAIAPRTP